MGIIEFLSAVGGNDKLSFQFLHQCINVATVRKYGGTEVRFSTDNLNPSDLIGKPRKVAMIVWMDYTDFERVCDAVKKDLP